MILVGMADDDDDTKVTNCMQLENCFKSNYDAEKSLSCECLCTSLAVQLTLYLLLCSMFFLSELNK